MCECCSYSMLQFKNDYADIFPPEIIKANNIKEVTIYTTPKRSASKTDTLFKTTVKEYKEMKFRFNNNGYIISQIFFNRNGKYHSIFLYSRDNENKVLTKTFNYLDSTGKIQFQSSSQKWIYKYSSNRLIKIKLLDQNFVEQADSISEYTAYEYDHDGRVITETNHYYFYWTQPMIFQTGTKYNDTTNTSVSITKSNGKLTSKVKSKYFANQKPMYVKSFDGRTGELQQEQTYTYNSRGQLVKFQIKDPAAISECPEGNNFEDIYYYSAINLIDHIRHHYKNNICELRFSYK